MPCTDIFALSKLTTDPVDPVVIAAELEASNRRFRVHESTNTAKTMPFFGGHRSANTTTEDRTYFADDQCPQITVRVYTTIVQKVLVQVFTGDNIPPPAFNMGSDATLLAAMGTLLPNNNDDDDDMGNSSPSPAPRPLPFNKARRPLRQNNIDQIFLSTKAAHASSAVCPTMGGGGRLPSNVATGSGAGSSHITAASANRRRSNSGSSVEIITGYEFDMTGPFGPRPRNAMQL